LHWVANFFCQRAGNESIAAAVIGVAAPQQGQSGAALSVHIYRLSLGFSLLTAG